MQAALPWVFVLAVFTAGWVILMNRHPAVFKKKTPDVDNKGPAQLVKEQRKPPITPPFFKDDKVQFMNGETKLTPGMVLEAWDDPHPNHPGHQRVLIRYWVDPKEPNNGHKETTTSSLKVILIERPGV